MNLFNIPSPASVLPNSKPHYLILDGLRGVAALMVMVYHLGEAYATSPATQWCNHGYLAVQFFFVLSGFVVGYAYDDRLRSKSMSTKQFLLRRFVRLHPMVIIAALIGVAAFLLQGSVTWEGAHVPLYRVLVAMVLTMLMIPVAPGSPFDIRGNGEMFPVNGPQWSLLMEYIGNIVFVLVLRHMTTRVLATFTIVLGVGCASIAMGNATGFGQLGPGWTLAGNYGWTGLVCMLFCFSAGLLMARVFKPRAKVKGAFWICSLAIIVLLAMPYAGTQEHAWLNGIYDSACVLIVFPALVWIGACGDADERGTRKACQFWGDVSYPVYIIHYPSMYLFYAWVWGTGVTWSQAWPVGLGIIIGNIALAWVLLRCYDQPVRQWLSRKWLKAPKK